MSPADFKETTAGRHVGLHGKVAGGSPLAVIENVEGLETELKSRLFLNREVLEESHIEVGPIGSDQGISRHISESQPCRHGIGCRVVLEKCIATQSEVALRRNVSHGIAREIRVR